MRRRINILTFNDFTAPNVNREAFILQAILEYQTSNTYRNALTAQTYYSTDNEAIDKRLGYLERQMRNKVNVKFHRLRNGFFSKAVKKLVLYLMGNGATLDDAIKEKIDRKFNNTMIIGAINACVDGVVWGFPDLDENGYEALMFYRATEFVPLRDRRTGKLMAGISFKPGEEPGILFIDLFEVDGITEYETSGNGSNIIETLPKRPYVGLNPQDVYAGKKIPDDYRPNYGRLPIFPLYANELGTSELTPGLKALIDAYDFVSSDWVDNTTLIEGLYGIIKNYGGQDAADLLSEIQQLKVIVQMDDSSAEINTVEMPYQSRQNLLDFLERRMYDDFLLPDSTNDGRAVTATEIKAAREDMDIKADLLEWQVAEFVENVLRLKGINDTLPDYKRRTTTNDTEMTKNIVSLKDSDIIDTEEAIRLAPIVQEDRKEALIGRVALQQLNEADAAYPIEDDENGRSSQTD